MNGLNEEEKKKVIQYVENGADFMLMPTTDLCNKIINKDPASQGLGVIMTAIILEQKPIRISSDMVKKYCKGTLDKKNKWIFDNSNIKVIPPQFE